MPEGVGYGLGSMQGQQPQDPMDMQFRQMSQNDPGQAANAFRAILAEKGIDMSVPLATTLTRYVSTGGMDATEALRRLSMFGR